MTPFEQGKKAGQWTDGQIQGYGFNSAQDCLEHQEQVYQEAIDELADIYKINPDFARQQVEYLEGIIASTRQSLRGK